MRGSKKKIGRGDRPVWQRRAASEDRGMPILFLLGVPGQSPRTPDQTNKVVAQRHPNSCARDGSRMAETRNPACGISRGSVHDSPAREAGRAGKMPFAYRPRAGTMPVIRSMVSGIGSKRRAPCAKFSSMERRSRNCAMGATAPPRKRNSPMRFGSASGGYARSRTRTRSSRRMSPTGSRAL